MKQHQKVVKRINQIRALVAVVALLMAGYLFWKIQSTRVMATSNNVPTSVRIVPSQASPPADK